MSPADVALDWKYLLKVFGLLKNAFSSNGAQVPKDLCFVILLFRSWAFHGALPHLGFMKTERMGNY